LRPDPSRFECIAADDESQRGAVQYEKRYSWRSRSKCL
jgi:hypothetical protein